MKKLTKLRLFLLFGILVTVAAFFVFEGKITTQSNVESTESVKVLVATGGHEEIIYDKELPSLEKPEKFVPEWQSYTVAQGDNFSLIGARQLGLNPSEVIKITDLSKDAIKLSELKQGQYIQFLLDKDGVLKELTLPIKPDLDYLVQRQGDDFTGQEVKKAITKTHQIYKGVVSSSLSGAMQDQGVPFVLAANAGELLGKRNDLRRDLRTGDVFKVMIASDEVDGELFSPKVEVIRLNGHRIKTSLFLHSDGQYYDERGRGLEPGFNRYPFAHSYRISSPFDLSRKHPATGLIRPHYGTDFATPVGTKVLSPADGVVKRLGHQRYAGNYLVVEHYNGYITRYFHLSKILVKKGEAITSGEAIALTGNTGRTTGAHLHYELHKKGHPVDPMLASLPASRDLKGTELVRFQEVVSLKMAALEKGENTLVVSDSSGLKESKPHI